MKYIIISTLLLIFTSCASTVNKKEDQSKVSEKNIFPTTLISTQNIEVSQVGF